MRRAREDDDVATRSMLERCRVDGKRNDGTKGTHVLLSYEALCGEVAYLRTEIRLLRRVLDEVRCASAPRWLGIDTERADDADCAGETLFESWSDGQEHPADVLDSIFKPENHEDEPCDGCGKRPSVSQGHGSYICRPCHDALPSGVRATVAREQSKQDLCACGHRRVEHTRPGGFEGQLRCGHAATPLAAPDPTRTNRAVRCRCDHFEPAEPVEER